MTYEEALETIKPGKYRHFKGNEYEVAAIARHSETGNPWWYTGHCTGAGTSGCARRKCGMKR